MGEIVSLTHSFCGLLLGFSGTWLPGESFEEESLVDSGQLFLGRHGKEFDSHLIEHSQVSAALTGKGLHE